MAGLHGTHSILAPAKINLYLNITGRRSDGFHTLDSLAAFADIGDRVVIEPSASFEFHVLGPFAAAFSPEEMESGPQSRNLAVRAAYDLARAAGRGPHVRITLQKNLPLASGIGGGSADAAAVLWGMMRLWDIPPEKASWLSALAANLGADVSACLACRPVRMRGIGNMLDDAPSLPEMPVLLLNPGIPCPTAGVYRLFKGPFATEALWPDRFDTGSFQALLRQNGNGLTAAAAGLVPDIAFALQALESQQGCWLARMSGSGATCFGLFENGASLALAEDRLRIRHPGWWIASGTLNRVERY